MAFSPDSETLAIGGNEITLWHRQSGKIVGTLPPYGKEVRVLAWHSKGRWLASGSDDGTIIIWDIRNQTQIKKLTQHRDGTVTTSVMGLAWSQMVFG